MTEHEPLSKQTMVGEQLAATNGHAPDEAAELRAKIAELESQLAATTAPEPEPDERQEALEIIGDYCEATITDIERVGDDLRPQRYFTAKHRRRTGEARRFGPITSAQLGNRKVWRQMLWEAVGGDPGQLLSEDKHRELLQPISVAERVVDIDHDDLAMWRNRVVRYVGRVALRIDARERGAVSRTIREAGAYVDQNGRAWLQADLFADHLRTHRRISVDDDEEVARALARLGFTSKKHSYRPTAGWRAGKERYGANTTAPGKRSPSGFIEYSEPTDDDGEDE